MFLWQLWVESGHCVWQRPAMLRPRPAAYATIALFVLAACARPVTSDKRPFNPVGTWQSVDGFTLKIDGRGHYTACVGSQCAGGDYYRLSAAPDEVVLKDFFKLDTTQRFIAQSEADTANGDGSQNPCGGAHQDHDGWCRNDLVFFDSVAPQDEAATCGDRDCTVVGNVESERGTLYRVN